MRDKKYNVKKNFGGVSMSDKKRKVGRPAVDDKKDIRFSIRLDDEMDRKLEYYCKAKGVTKAKVIREALNKYFE